MFDHLQATDLLYFVFKGPFATIPDRCCLSRVKTRCTRNYIFMIRLKQLAFELEEIQVLTKTAFGLYTLRSRRIILSWKGTT